MTETAIEALVPHALYSHKSIVRIATDDNHLVDLTGDVDFQDTPNEETRLIALPGTPDWASRMITARIAAFRKIQQLTRVNNERNTYIKGLGQALLEEAINRDWCSEYQEFAEEWDLPKINKTYVVTITLTVSARDEDAACDLVRDAIGINEYSEVVVNGPSFEATED